MRGLAFPPNDAANRETSYEEGTPISNVDDIPIDPALGGTPIDPALMIDEKTLTDIPAEVAQLEQPASPSLEERIRQYSQGPQGDPFAPQIVQPFFPIEEAPPPPPPAPKPKRKRKVQRENKCGFCGGDDAQNKSGEAELMTTCHECGRSGHPSCMELEKIGDIIRTYPWKCIECKNCEVCQEKGDDERILFCDWCDRGWHLDCMDPPLEGPPEGDWRCPMCPEVVDDGGHEYLASEYPHQSSVPTMREGSIASTSRSVAEVTPAPISKARRGKKASTKRKRAVPVPIPASDGSDEDAMDVVETPVASSRRGRTSRPSAKVKASTASSDDEPQPRSARAPKRKRPRDSSPPPQLSRVRLRVAIPRGGKGKEREVEEEESPHGLFDDILGLPERDVSKTTPVQVDKIAFERSRILAEEKLAQAMHPPPPPPPPLTATPSRNSSTYFDSHLSARPLRSAVLQQISASTPRTFDFSNSPGPSTPGGTSLPKFEPGVLRIRSIRFGPYEIRTWYDAPFPEEYATIPDGRLWICEFCLKYMKSRFKAIRHQMKCKARHPPGDEIYRDGDVSIFEVDGRRNKIYCQNLCLLSKMFLDHKSLFYDVEPFLFYVITQVDENGARFVGYFSKEKRCPKEYNLSCIMTLPVRQRQGWGNLLIDFSYLLSKIEQRVGSPEKPLSSLGALGYRNYWTLAIMRFLEKAPDNIRLEDISSATSMTIEDVCNTLIQQNMIFIRETTPPPVRPSPGQSIKFPKGRKNGPASGARRSLARAASSLYGSPSPQKAGANGVNGDGKEHKQPANGHGYAERQGPFVAPTSYDIRFDRDKAAEYMRRWESKNYKQLRPEKLQWTPYLVARATAEGAYGYVAPGAEGGHQEAEPATATEEKHLPAQDTALLGDVAKELAIRSGELLESGDNILTGLASLADSTPTTATIGASKNSKKKAGTGTGGRGRRPANASALTTNLDEPTPTTTPVLSQPETPRPRTTSATGEPEPPLPNGTEGPSHMDVDSPTGVGADAQPHTHAGAGAEDGVGEVDGVRETPSRQRTRSKAVNGNGRGARRKITTPDDETEADEAETAKELLEASRPASVSPPALVHHMHAPVVSLKANKLTSLPVLLVTPALDEIKAESSSASPALSTIPMPRVHTPISMPSNTAPFNSHSNADDAALNHALYPNPNPRPMSSSPLPLSTFALPPLPSLSVSRSPAPSHSHSPAPTTHHSPLPTPLSTHSHLTPTPPPVSPSTHQTPTPPPPSALPPHTGSTTPPEANQTQPTPFPSDAPSPQPEQPIVPVKRGRGRPRRKPLDPNAPPPPPPPVPPPQPVTLDSVLGRRSLRSSGRGAKVNPIATNGSNLMERVLMSDTRAAPRSANANPNGRGRGMGTGTGIGVGTLSLEAYARPRADVRPDGGVDGDGDVNGTPTVDGVGHPSRVTVPKPLSNSRDTPSKRRVLLRRHAPDDDGDNDYADVEDTVGGADAMDEDEDGGQDAHQLNGHGRTLRSSRTTVAVNMVGTHIDNGAVEQVHGHQPKRPAAVQMGGGPASPRVSKRRRIESSPEMDIASPVSAPVLDVDEASGDVAVPMPSVEEGSQVPTVSAEAVQHPADSGAVGVGFAESDLRSTLGESSGSGEEDAEGEEDEEYAAYVLADGVM